MLYAEAAALERDIRRVLADVRTEFEPAEAQEVEMFLDAGEYGLAFQSMCAVLTRKRRPVSAATYANIYILAESMGADPVCWEGLEVS
jgi:hypothetical protein